MFWSKNKQNRYAPAYPSFAISVKVGFKGGIIARTCFLDVIDVAAMLQIRIQLLVAAY